MILEHFNYKDFQQKFYTRFKGIAVFDVGDVNFIKVIMECLVVRYGYKGKIRTYIFFLFPGVFLFLKNIFIFLFRYESKKKGQVFINKYCEIKPRIVLIDNGRTVTKSDGDCVSVYFHNIRQKLTDKGIPFFHYSETQTRAGYHDVFFDENFRDSFQSRSLLNVERKVLKDLITLYKNCVRYNCFTNEELTHIRFGLTVFFDQFRLWNFYFSQFKPNGILLLGHYHHEGIIMACRINGVRVIELQHGLIAPEDIFYVMPKLFASIRSRALFPDEIHTYGKYWSEILKKGYEFSEDQIKLSGYYLFEEKTPSQDENVLLRQITGTKPVVLVTTQPALHASFVNYIEKWSSSLSKQGLQAVFIVKLHPADDEKWYETLRRNENIFITRMRLEVLFQFAYIHVTSYSTTVYDALRYGVMNYSIDFPESSDYVEHLVSESLTHKINEAEFPAIPQQKPEIINADFSIYFKAADYEFLNAFKN